MSDSCPHHSEGRTAFTVAASVLGLVALAQVAAVAVFVSKYEAPAVAVDSGASGEGATAPLLHPGSPSTPRSIPPVVVNRTQPVAIAPIDPSTMQPPVRSLENSPIPGTDISQELVAIQNKAAVTYLDKGMASREQGDMRGALRKFRAASDLEPNHPRILYEFAMTFEEMGYNERATQVWRAIYELGEIRGGDYYLLADFRLKGKKPNTEAVPVPEPSNQVLKIARAVAERDLAVSEGERVLLNVLISALPGSQPNPQDVHVRVDFYDMVNESTVDLTHAVPSNRWVTLPIDWQGQTEELLEVAYFLPPQTDDEILEFGQRKYHGYVAKVYYRDQIQDVIAEPRTLLDISDRPDDGIDMEGPFTFDETSLLPQ